MPRRGDIFQGCSMFRESERDTVCARSRRGAHSLPTASLIASVFVLSFTQIHVFLFLGLIRKPCNDRLSGTCVMYGGVNPLTPSTFFVPV